MKFRKKPITIEAIQWTGDNEEEILQFFNWVELDIDVPTKSLIIQTLEGMMFARKDDWIIKGEFYPCKPDIFELTYEKVEE